MKRFGGLSVAGLAALGILVTGAEAEEWFDTSASLTWYYANSKHLSDGGAKPGSSVSFIDEYIRQFYFPNNEPTGEVITYRVDGEASASASTGSLSVNTRMNVFASWVEGDGDGTISSWGTASARASYGSTFVVDGPWEWGTLVELPVTVELSGAYDTPHEPYLGPGERWIPASVGGGFEMRSSMWGQTVDRSVAIRPDAVQTYHTFTILTIVGDEWNWMIDLGAHIYAIADAEPSSSTSVTSTAGGTLTVHFGPLIPIFAPMYDWVPSSEDGSLSGWWDDFDRWNHGHAPLTTSAGVLFDIDSSQPYEVINGIDRIANRLHVGSDKVTLDLEGSTLSLLSHAESTATHAIRIGLKAGDDGSLTLRNGTLIADQDVEVQSAAGASATLVIEPDLSLYLQGSGGSHPALRVGTYGGGGTAKLHVQLVGGSAGRLQAGSLVVGESGEAVFDGEVLVGNAIGIVDDPLVNFLSEVTISDGGKLNAQRIEISGAGAVTLSGPDTLVQTPTLVIGEKGAGQLTADGAGARLEASVVQVGVNGGVGTLTVTNAAQASGTTLFLGTAGGTGFARFTHGSLGEFNSNILVGSTDATGVLEIGSGAVVSTQGMLNVGSGGTVSLTGGALMAAGGNVSPGGRIIGVGSLILTAPLVNAGYIAPGLSPGQLTIDGDVVFQEGSVLEIEIAGIGEGQFDVLNVTGNLTMGGRLVLRFIDGFAPLQGQTFDLLTAGTLEGSFDVTIENLAEGFEYDLSLDPTGLTLIALTDGVYIPEPATAMILLTTLAGVSLSRRR